MIDKHKKWLIASCYASVGNSVLWWGPNSAGYTSSVDDAGRYTTEEALNILRMKRGDKAYTAHSVERLSHRHMDIQQIDKAIELKG